MSSVLLVESKGTKLIILYIHCTEGDAVVDHGSREPTEENDDGPQSKLWDDEQYHQQLQFRQHTGHSAAALRLDGSLIGIFSHHLLQEK